MSTAAATGYSAGAQDTEQPEDQGKPSSSKAMRLKLIAWALMLSASLFNLLNFNAYPIIRPEIGLVLCAIVLVALVLASVEKMAPRVAFLLTGMLFWIGADLNTDQAYLPLAIAALVTVAAWFWNTNVVKLAIAVFGTVAVSQAATAWTTTDPVGAGPAITAAASPPSKLPPVIHLLVDSALGMEGMASEPSFAGLRAESIAFYTKHGFRLYHDAYSRHANTANSVPYILSFGNAPQATVSQLDERQRPPKLDYFQLLSDRGYDVSVLGANYLDLCTGQAVHECDQSPHSQLDAITKLPMSVRDRAVTVGIALASLSSLTTALYETGAIITWRLGGPAPIPMRNLKKLATIDSLVDFKELQLTLARPQWGRAYFVHLLIPHEPYVFNRDCALRPRDAWTTERSAAARELRHKNYREQTRCLNKLLGETLENLDDTPAGRDAIVIVHGDHGSRIVDERPLVDNPDAEIEDVAMTYSTLFAIKSPDLEAGVEHGRASLDELIEGFAASEFDTAPQTRDEPAEIILATADWIPKKRVTLPDFDEN